MLVERDFSSKLRGNSNKHIRFLRMSQHSHLTKNLEDTVK